MEKIKDGPFCFIALDLVDKTDSHFPVLDKERIILKTLLTPEYCRVL